MGTSAADQLNVKDIDPTVGGLVWVRRRNGSWWPGQILDAEEFPDNCLASPRSGVPIKLLGRDDTSVDWYNLEKSKRVKAFRCGDYDGCIEKAKVSASNMTRKAAKYAKRENAIICALELESAFLSKRQENNGFRPDKLDSEPSGDCANNALPDVCLRGRVDLTTKQICPVEKNSKISHAVAPCEEENKSNGLKRLLATQEKQRTSNDSEDDGSEGVKRMRGLNDLGKGSDKKVYSDGLNDSETRAGVLLRDLRSSDCAVSTDQASGSRVDPLPSFKKKRTKVVFHEFLKRKNRRRMLTKVLQCNTLVTVPIIYEDFPNPCMSKFSQGISSNGASSRFEQEGAYENGTMKSDSVHAHNDSALHSGKSEDSESFHALELPDSDSENLFDVPLVTEDEFADGIPPYIAPCGSLKPQMESFSEHLSQNGQYKANNERGHAVSSSPRLTKGTSEWQLKGKRNSRHMAKTGELDVKRFVDTSDMDIDYPEEFSPSSDVKANRSPSSGGSLPSDGLAYSSRSHRLHHGRFPVIPKYENPDHSIRSIYPDSILFNVEIEVKASYRPHHVPYISLMSKLNGKAIIGHPIAVEVLEDGACDSMVNFSELFQTSDSYQLDEEEDYGEEELEEVDGVDLEGGGGDYCLPKKKLKAWEASHGHGAASTPLSPLKKSLLSRSKTKVNGSSGKKTRTLSSLTGSLRRKKVGKKKKKNHHQEGKKAKVQSLKSSVVTCVPLKVVFSRINEALNGPRGANHIS